jgi:purine-binding chemotaxis protein CheW
VEDRSTGLSLVCRVQARLCALPLEHVVETMRPLAVEPLANAPSFVLGLAVVRGEPLAVVDAARVMGMQDAPIGRFVTVAVGVRRIALAVGDVVGMRRLPPGSLRALPPLLHEAAGDVVDAVGLLDAELLLMLRSARLLPDDVPEGARA